MSSAESNLGTCFYLEQAPQRLRLQRSHGHALPVGLRSTDFSKALPTCSSSKCCADHVIKERANRTGLKEHRLSPMTTSRSGMSACSYSRRRLLAPRYTSGLLNGREARATCTTRVQGLAACEDLLVLPPQVRVAGFALHQDSPKDAANQGRL